MSATNSPEHWNKAWSDPDAQAWRDDAMAPVYERILELAPRGRPIIDIGGGVGHFASRAKAAGFEVEVWEHNQAAVDACRAAGIEARLVDLERNDALPIPEGATVVATEVLEHLSLYALDLVLVAAERAKGVCFFSVPNDRLTPAEEPEHVRSWTAKGFLDSLRSIWGSKHARVEVLGHPARLDQRRFPSDRGQRGNLLGVVGFEKAVPLSVCFPARDEAADIEETLASFRGVADELVVGIDPRTVDATREIAAKYADVVFELTDLRGPPDKPEEWVDPKGIHFAHARNQCIDRCSHEWVFMTEAHERLQSGQDALLHLEQLPEGARVGGVMRIGGRPLYRQTWMFPWLAKKAPDIRYSRGTHNTLDFPEGTFVVVLPQVSTLHMRVHERDVARQAQRKIQNRRALYEDWFRRGSEHSLHYLGAEWREWNPEKAVQYLREYLAIGRQGALRYQTRLVLAKELANLGRHDEAEEVLHAASGDDWSRIEHFVFLGDIASEREEHERALQFYSYAATSYRRRPISTWFVDLPLYGWMLAQRMVEKFAALGRLAEAEAWAASTLEDLRNEHDAPPEFIEEAETNLRRIQEARNGSHQQAAE